MKQEEFLSKVQFISSPEVYNSNIALLNRIQDIYYIPFIDLLIMGFTMKESYELSILIFKMARETLASFEQLIDMISQYRRIIYSITNVACDHDFITCGTKAVECTKCKQVFKTK